MVKMTMKKLRKDTGLSRKKAIKALQELQQKGYIKNFKIENGKINLEWELPGFLAAKQIAMSDRMET